MKPLGNQRTTLLISHCKFTSFSDTILKKNTYLCNEKSTLIPNRSIVRFNDPKL